MARALTRTDASDMSGLQRAHAGVEMSQSNERTSSWGLRQQGGAPRLRAAGWAVLLAIVVSALVGAGCGGGDDGGGGVSLAELKSRLPVAGDLGLESERDFEWDNGTDFVAQGLFYSQGTAPSELIAAFDDAGFQGAAGSQLADPPHKWNVRISVAGFDSDEGAVRARDLLHEEDLKQPWFAACVMSPREYELDQVPDSAAVHQVLLQPKPPPGLLRSEGYLAEFAIGPQLYVVQTDSPPKWTSSAEFDRAVMTVYEAASRG
jgi:hypothetical protein